MIDAKAVVIDDGLALAGSANLDERSLFLNDELMVSFYGRPASSVSPYGSNASATRSTLSRKAARNMARGRGRNAVVAGFSAISYSCASAQTLQIHWPILLF